MEQYRYVKFIDGIIDDIDVLIYSPTRYKL